jgi:hypothetical protein
MCSRPGARKERPGPFLLQKAPKVTPRHFFGRRLPRKTWWKRIVICRTHLGPLEAQGSAQVLERRER